VRVAPPANREGGSFVSTGRSAATAATTGGLRGWLSVRHSLGTEAALVVTLYGIYELARGLVVGNTKEADSHAGQLVALERSLHLFVEGKVQHAADALPGLAGLLGVAYLTLHLGVTAVVLLWLHQRRPTAFPFVEPHFSPPARSPSSASSPTRPRHRGWPESASPTPSPTGTSTSTKASSARSTTPSPPSPACTSATR
jgi:hypothetical protein